jgi:hypothetical protein
MDYAEFQEYWEKEADKEYELYMSKSVSELKELLKKRKVGEYYQIWRAIADKATVEEMGWDLYNYLKAGGIYLNKYHCAKALLKLTDASLMGISEGMLTNQEKFDVERYLTFIEGLIETKIKEKGSKQSGIWETEDYI